MQPGDGSIHSFETPEDWFAWLDRNRGSSAGIWMRLAKKASRISSISYAEALDGALCYGWIDGQKKSESADFWLQRFVPRARKSIWSKRNRQKALGLIQSGLMKPAGLAVIERAQADGRWEAAYDSPANAKVPRDFQVELDRDARAEEFFKTLDKGNRYAILFRIQTVKKPETRARRIQQFVQMLANHEKIHP